LCEIKNAALCPPRRPVPSLDLKVKPEIGNLRKKVKFKEAHPTFLENFSRKNIQKSG
jgi:hypothetical protein